MIEVIFFNCKGCGRPLIYKSIRLTEAARKSGYCVTCALIKLSEQNGRAVLLAPKPTPEARLN